MLYMVLSGLPMKSWIRFMISIRKNLLSRFKLETFRAIEEKISLNPILHNFQLTVNKYKIENALIEYIFEKHGK